MKDSGCLIDFAFTYLMIVCGSFSRLKLPIRRKGIFWNKIQSIRWKENHETF
ncbi:hypothetical protein [Leptospira noguchii]|uniref:hypothetical protein n=1 Tax=Leptospira noguchii TaxID=28182 RepID=UPI0002BE6775|nr:hypothetical protein [Leptospira noguchii]EMI62951.1 hypothetical protein LEP1GSC072_1951 [Leptospira noguchii str. Bonito]EMS87561.1 hypothetical protein LEP1GSC073_3473 [Leptospira noguchii str. Cascata]